MICRLLKRGEAGLILSATQPKIDVTNFQLLAQFGIRLLLLFDSLELLTATTAQQMLLVGLLVDDLEQLGRVFNRQLPEGLDERFNFLPKNLLGNEH